MMAIYIYIIDYTCKGLFRAKGGVWYCVDNHSYAGQQHFSDCYNGLIYPPTTPSTCHMPKSNFCINADGASQLSDLGKKCTEDHTVCLLQSVLTSLVPSGGWAHSHCFDCVIEDLSPACSPVLHDPIELSLFFHLDSSVLLSRGAHHSHAMDYGGYVH